MHYRNKTLLAQTIACCAIVVSAIAARPAHAQSSVYAAAAAAMIYVDCAATSRGNGSAKHPYWRITDALSRARRLRREDPRRIVIRVAPGICSGNFETQPTGQTTRPPELLPLVLNVPDLTLHGAGIMDYAEGYPVAQRPGTATTVTVDTLHYGWVDNTVMFVGPTADGGRADGAIIEGLAIDDAFMSVHGIWITRTPRFIFRNNVVEHVNFGAVNVGECSGSIVGNVLHDGTPGLLLAAGTKSNPSKLYVGGNSVTANLVGIAVFGDSGATAYLEMGANPLKVLPYPVNPTSSEIGNHIDVEVEGNDVSYNFSGGLDFAILGASRYPYSLTGNINASVHDNRFMDNAGYPFVVETGYVFRGTSAFWTNPDLYDFPEGYLGFYAAPFVTHGPNYGPYSGIVNASFERNLWSNLQVAPIAPAILTFSSTNIYDPTTGEPDPGLISHYVYMSNSRLNLEDEDGLFSLPGVIRDDLRPFDPLDGTALHNRTRITR